MSKNITILEGSTSKQFSGVKKLRTDVQGGGSCTWVPEDETQLTTKHITENGTYKAEDDDKYGYSQVSVRVPGGSGSADSSGYPSGTVPPGGIGSGIVGTDDDGNDEFIGVDSDGNLVEVPLPSRIVMIVSPTKTDYVDGETISLVGATISAKNGDGTTWTNADYPNGHVPIGEISLEPSVAESGSGTGTNAFVPADNIFNLPAFNFSLCEPYFYWWQPAPVGNNYAQVIKGTQIYATNYREGSGMRNIMASGISDVFFWAFGIVNDPSELNPTDRLYPVDTYTYDGRTVYYVTNNAVGTWENLTTNAPKNDFNITQAVIQRSQCAWLMVYGGYASDSETITLKWERPVDSKQLSTTMQINVTGTGNTGSNGGNNTSGGEAGF